MLELASSGAKVLHNRCVEIGKKYNIPIYVKSTFELNSQGTLVTSKETMEDLCISGIAKEDNIARITLIGKNNKIGRIYNVFKLLANNNIAVDIIVQSLGEHISKDISFSIKEKDLDEALELLHQNASKLDIKEINSSTGMSKVSIIGLGLANNPQVLAQVFETLYENNINMHMISTSEIKISVLVNENVAETTLKELHKQFIELPNKDYILI